jgi:hypothetical protein
MPIVSKGRFMAGVLFSLLTEGICGQYIGAFTSSPWYTRSRNTNPRKEQRIWKSNRGEVSSRTRQKDTLIATSGVMISEKTEFAVRNQLHRYI